MILENYTSPDRHGHQYILKVGHHANHIIHMTHARSFDLLYPEAMSAHARLATTTLVIFLLLCKAMFLDMLGLLHPSHVNANMFDIRVTRDASIMEIFLDGASLRKDTLLDLVRDHPIMLPSYI